VVLQHPHLSPEDTWQHLFEQPLPDSLITDAAKDTDNLTEPTTSFRPSSLPAHKEILRILRENEPDTITIVAIGPLTNCALAAAEDPEAFLRVKEVVTMGGAVDAFGNVSPVAEFNVFADASAAARVYSLTSPHPSSTMPPPPLDPTSTTTLPPYPANLSRQLRVALLSLDITENHVVSRAQFESHIAGPRKSGSPLAEWLSAFMTPMLDKMEALHVGHSGESASFALHDPLTIWYVLTRDTSGWEPSPAKPRLEDIRVETSGQWTKGMTLLDRRTRHRRNSDGPVPHDRDNWLGSRSGNQILRLRRSGFEQRFGEDMIRAILGVL
jgi:inosine-uridine nucleoside N-ribohydrolase